jgi:hypothetical protein
MKSSPPFYTAVLFFIFSLLLPLAASSQDVSSIDRDLAELENLIQDTVKNSEAQVKQLEDLQKNLTENGELIGNYESIIQDLLASSFPFAGGTHCGGLLKDTGQVLGRVPVVRLCRFYERV